MFISKCFVIFCLFDKGINHGAENQEIRKSGIKGNLTRIKVLQLLEAASESSHHMSAEEVYKSLLDAGEDVGLATVYRVLTQFETAGLVVRHNSFEGGHSVFEIAKGEHHDHMVCTETRCHNRVL